MATLICLRDVFESGRNRGPGLRRLGIRAGSSPLLLVNGEKSGPRARRAENFGKVRSESPATLYLRKPMAPPFLCQPKETLMLEILGGLCLREETGRSRESVGTWGTSWSGWW